MISAGAGLCSSLPIPQKCVLNSLPDGGAKPLIFLKNECLAWGKTGLICTDLAKKVEAVFDKYFFASSYGQHTNSLIKRIEVVGGGGISAVLVD